MMFAFCRNARLCVPIGRAVSWLVCLGASGLAGSLAGPLPEARASRHRSASVAHAAPTPVWPWPDSLDALVAAPKYHRVLFENDRVRVLEVTVPPHVREPLHTHRWPSVVYREQNGKGRYYDATGQLLHESTRPFQKGPALARARWQEPEGPHAVENTDEQADRFIRVELKQ